MRFGFNYGMGKGSARYRNSFLISYLMDTVYTDGAMDRFLDNVGSNGSNNDATANASNHIFLNAQSVPYPVLHELSADLNNTTAPTYEAGDETATFTAGTPNDFDLAVTVIGTLDTRPGINTSLTETTSSSSTYIATFDAVINSGTCIITNVAIGGTNFTVNQTVVNGTNQVEVSSPADGTLSRIRFDGTNLFDISVTNWTVKEITLPTASYLSIMQADGTIKQLSSTGDVGNDYILNDTFEGSLGDWYARLRGTVELSGNKMLMTTAQVATDGIIASSPPIITTGERITVEVKVDEINTTDPTSVLEIYRQQQSPLSIGVNKINMVGADFDTEFRHRTNPTVGDTFLIDYIKVYKRLPISTTYSQTDSHQFTFNHTSPLSAADKAAIEADPNLIFRVWFNAEVLPSGFAKSDMGNFFSGNEGLASGAYVQDLSIDLGSTILDSTAPTIANSDEITTFTGNTDNSFDLAVTTVGTSTTRPRISTSSTPASSSKLYIFTIDVVLNSGICVLQSINNAGTFVGGSNVYPSQQITTGTYTYIGYGTEASTTNRIQFEGTNLFDISVTKWEIREAAAVEIKAYDTATRTTLANQSKGATGLKLIQDGSGRTTGTVTDNTTQWKQGANAPTGWVITSPFTITEIIDGDTYTWTSDGNKYINSVASGTYVLPTGIWELNEFGFDGVTPLTVRGKTSMIDAVVIP